MVPDPFVVVQTWPEGGLEMVTLYVVPSARGVLKVKDPFAVMLRLSLPLFCIIRTPLWRLLTVPPTVWVPAHVTRMLATLADPIVPDPFVIVQNWPDGWARTVARYAVPPSRGELNVNEPFADTLRVFPPLFCRISVPLRPVTVPPTVYFLLVLLLELVEDPQAIAKTKKRMIAGTMSRFPFL